MICDGRHLQMQVEILSIHPKVFFLWLDMGPTLKSDLFPSETSMKKTNFACASGYQLEIPSALGVGACVHVSFPKALLT